MTKKRKFGDLPKIEGLKDCFIASPLCHAQNKRKKLFSIIL